MCAIGTLSNSILQQGLCMSSIRCSTTNVKFSPFARVERVKPNESNSLKLAFDLDTNAQKINLAGEVYRNGDGKPHVFQAVRKAQLGVACEDKFSNEPLPILGNPDFIQAANELVLNKAAPALTQKRVLGVQTRSSMDALQLAAQFLRQKMKCTVCSLAQPSCELYERVFKSAGFTCHTYQYYSESKAELNIYGLVADLMSAPEGAVVLLDACAQNPTGLDPSIDEWQLIANIIRCKKLLPLFHLESQGLASGDTTQDAWPVRYFVDSGHDLLCAQSFVKNFGLYNETLGQLMFVFQNSNQLETVRQQFEDMLRENNDQSSSVFASRIVAKILNNASLRHDWSLALKDVHDRIKQIRTAISNKLEVLQTPGNWETLKDQNGLLLYTNLKAPQLKQLCDKHIYISNSGRINLGALDTKSVDFVASAINDVMLSTKGTTAPHVYSIADQLMALQQKTKSVYHT